MTILEVPLLWTSLIDGLDGLRLKVRGELSNVTAPALDSLFNQLVAEHQHVVSIDLREADVRPPAGEHLLERWGAVLDGTAGVYRLGWALGWANAMRPKPHQAN